MGRVVLILYKTPKRTQIESDRNYVKLSKKSPDIKELS